MIHRIGRPMILTALAALASACVIDVGEEGNLSDGEAVRANNALAVEACGPGKVKSVDTDGFTCLEQRD